MMLATRVLRPINVVDDALIAERRESSVEDLAVEGSWTEV